MKKLILTLSFIVISSIAFAKSDIVNIYDKPRKVPPTTIHHESGKRFLLSDFKGDFVVVVFWSKKCLACVRELDDLNAFQSIVKENGIKVVMVTPSSEWRDFNETKAFMKKRNASDLDVYFDENGRLAADFGIYTTPHNVLVNKKGEEIGRIRGSADWDDEDVIEYMYNLKAKHG